MYEYVSKADMISAQQSKAVTNIFSFQHHFLIINFL